MKALVFSVIVVFGLTIGAIISAFPGGFGTPPSPQPIQVNSQFPHWDVQVHSRDTDTWGDNSLESIMAQHGPDCSPPPATHENHSYVGAVFICSGHVMTAINASGYGEIMLTPSQVVNCSAGCTVQFDLSTQKMSGRDWPDLWLTPWDDNLTLPLAPFFPDLQGFPRRGIHVTSETGQNSWLLQTINNYQHTDLNTAWWVGMHEGIVAGTNQAAVRQTFRLTVVPGAIKFERLASTTASAIVWTLDNNGNPGFSPCACLMASDYIVQFGHHSYTPTKDGAGVPATWHWFNDTNSPLISPASPFTLIHTTPRMVPDAGGIVTFNAPAPANARLRFSGLCRVRIDGVEVQPQVKIRAGLSASFFVPIAQGKQSVNVSFVTPDDWYQGPCNAKDFAIWSKGGTTPSTPTPIVPTPIPSPIGTNTPVPPTSTPMPTVVLPTPTPTIPASTPTPQLCRVQVRNANNTGWVYNTALGSYTGVLVNGKCV